MINLPQRTAVQSAPAALPNTLHGAAANTKHAQNGCTLPPSAGQLMHEPIAQHPPSLAIAPTSNMPLGEPARKSLKRKAENILDASSKRQRSHDSRPAWQGVATKGASSPTKTAMHSSAELMNALCSSTPFFAGTNAVSVTMNALSGHVPLAAEGRIGTNPQPPILMDEEAVDEAVCMEKAASLFPYDLTNHRLDKGKNYIGLISRIVGDISSGKTPVDISLIKFVVKFGIENINSLHRHYVDTGNTKNANQLAAHLVKTASRNPVFSEALKAHYMSTPNPMPARLDIATKLKKSWGL